MNVSSLRELLDQFDIRLKKSLGQNFLHDPAWLARVVAAGDVGTDDLVLEIGAGAGSLTHHLARKARHVTAVELDERLLPLLAHTLAEHDNVTLVQGDILELSIGELMSGGAEPALSLSKGAPGSGRALDFKVIANIPYYITAAILRHLLGAEVKPSLMVLTVQVEVAERIVAAPGAMSVLAVSVQFYGEPRIVGRIPAGAFFPRPEVDSAIVRIDLHPKPRVQVSDVERFFRVVRAGFGQKRKQLQNALANGLRLDRKQVTAALEAAGVDPRRRAETLAIEEWEWVAERLRDASSGLG